MPTAPALQGIDHVHVMVRDRAAALAWYREVLASWSVGGGPLTVADAAGRVHIALFEHAPAPVNRATVALGVDGAAFTAWREHLSRVLGQPVEVVDHEMSLSLYLRDPDGNPYEITTYDVNSAPR